MKKTRLVRLHRIVDRVQSVVGIRREWWSVFLARLPISSEDVERFGMRTYKHAADEIEEIATRPSEVDLSLKHRRLSASIWLRMNRFSVPVKPEFDISLVHASSPADEIGHYTNKLELRYRMEPQPSRLFISWAGVVREWIVPRSVVETTSPRPGLIKEVCATWSDLQQGRLVRLLISWVEPWDGYYDHYTRIPVRTEVSFLPKADAMNWRGRWMGDERCLIRVEITDWRESPQVVIQRPVEEADQNAIALHLARQRRENEQR